MYPLNIVLLSILFPVGNLAGFVNLFKQIFNQKSHGSVDQSSISGGKGVDYINNHPSWKYLPTDVCGKTRLDKLTGRIVGGEEAKIGEFPFICLLGFQYSLLDIEPEFTCGCTLISKYYVVTAAHCGEDNNVVRLGEHDTTKVIDCQDDVCAPRAQDIGVRKYLLNLYDKSASNQNDINMILLKSPAKFNDFVIPACLPRGPILSQNLIGQHVKIAGWGLTDSSDDTSASDRLMYIVAPIVEQQKCNTLFRRTLASSQYCVGYDSGKDSCNGDSGGPMFKSIRTGKERRIYLLGLTSFGLLKCGYGQGVYTRVMSFLPQILDNITQ
ncbi:unnamed protein product [Phaedon cochleariae]|uniref:Peptidase S1 domain-containing protein n=1 Tax=Phaedon cochleariae TaxID=80249 RepID=A0A9P0DUZ2_PHACE|nr:unnamed protein product [Phaedon cochleariae]